MQDTLSDMLVRIKNAQMMGKEDVLIIDSKLNRCVCEVLVDEGFVQRFEKQDIEKKPYLNVFLKYYSDKPVIADMKRVSKSSKRVYKKARELPKIVNGFGVLIVSTPKGVMSHLNAKKQNLGGEVLIEVK
jgi:small subunit ribosomal protein S8